MTRTRTALVIGGGIAGPVAAMALHRADIRATVYEAHPGTAEGVGAALSIAPNGLAALAVIGADQPVRRIGSPIRAIALQSWTGKRLAELTTPAGLPDQQLVWRAELYQQLYDEAGRQGIPIEHGKRLRRLDNGPREVTAHFADGSTATADVLIGADGIRSVVRGQLDPAAPAPRYTGLLNFGARLAHSGLPPTDGVMYMTFGKRAFFGYAVDDDGSAVWFVNLPRREPLGVAECRAIPAPRWLATLREAFAADRTAAPVLLDRTDPADLLVIGPMEDIPRVPTWSRGRAVLIGDAAHATSPSSGQGASLAIESAVQLARCLRDLPHEDAFAAYERLRRARCEKIIATAARTNSNKAAGPVARVLRDLMLPVLMKRLATPERTSWQFGYRIDWDTLVEPATPTEKYSHT